MPTITTPAAPDPSLSFTLPGVPPLAQPTFTTGPNDKLATVDNYTAKGGVVNSIQDQLSNLGISVPDVLRGGAAIASLLPIISGIKKGALTTNPQALVARLLASSAQITAAFSFLGPSVQGEILSGINELAPIAITVAGLAKQASVTNFSNLMSVGNLINSFTRDATMFGIIDPGSIASIVGTIVKQAGGYGVQGTFGAVMTGITDVSIIAAASGVALPGVIITSDSASLNQMARMLPPGSLLTTNPQVLAQFSSAFSRSSPSSVGASTPIGTDAENFNALFGTTDLPSTYEYVDPSWNTAARVTDTGTSSATDISSITGASSDFTSMVSNGVKSLPPDDPRQDYALVTTYPNTDVMSNLQTSFPYVPFGTGTSSVASSASTASPTTNTVTDQVAQNFPAASTVPSTSNDDSQYVETVWGTKVAVGSHSLLGYTNKGVPEYADAGYNDGAMLFPNPS